jgi:hypothetical protein
MPKVYIIQELGQEYNDEYYSINDKGTPEKVFFNKQRAEEEFYKLEIERWKGLDLYQYDYETYDYEEIIPYYNSIFKKNIQEHYDLTIPDDVTDEQIKEFIKTCKSRYRRFFSFYSLIEMEVNE